MQKSITLRWAIPYSLVSMARDAVFVFVLSFYFLYLYKAIDLPLTFIIPLFILVKIFDLIKEPFIGMVMDRYCASYQSNKFRISVLLGGIFNALSVVLMFNVPQALDMPYQFIFSTVAFLIWTISFSFIDLSTWSLTATFDTDHKTREIISSLARSAALIGFCLTLISTSIFFTQNSILPQAARVLSGSIFSECSIVIALITILGSLAFAATFNKKEKPHKVGEFKDTMSTFFGNDQLMITFFVTVLQQIGLCVFVCTHSYFLLTLKTLPSENEVFYMVQIPWIVAALLGFLSFHPLAKLFGRKNVFIGANILSLTSCLCLFTLYSTGDLNISNFSFLLVAIAIGFALSMTSTTVMTADCVDYGEFKFGSRAECMNFSVQTISSKFGGLFSFLISAQSFSYADIFIKNQMLTSELYSINLCMFIVAVCSIGMTVIYLHYYKLHGSFFENILNTINSFSNGNKPYVKNNVNSVRYALDEHCVLFNLKTQNLDEIIRVLTDRLFNVKAIKSKQDFLDGINEKIKENPAGIAHGIAIPHARGSFVKRSALAVATLATPINCGAIDDKPCDLIFLIAVPDDGVSHMNLLGNLSLMLSAPGFADKLRRSGSSEEITKRLISCEKNLFK